MNYYAYIFSDTFGEFEQGEVELIENLQKNRENDISQFLDSDTLELEIGWALETENFALAAERLEYAKQYFPNSEEFQFLEILLEKRENVENAIEMCSAYYQKTNDNDVLLLKSTLLFVAKQFEEADKLFYTFINKEFAEEDDRARFLFNMALFLATEDFTEEDGDVNVRTAFRIDFYIRKYIDEALTLNFKIDDIKYFVNGFFEYAYEDIAKEIVNKVIDKDACNITLWRALAKICSANGDYADAAEAYKNLIALHDEDNYLYSKSAACFQAIGRHKEAIDNYTLQIEKHPELCADKSFFITIMLAIGVSFVELEKYEEAIEVFTDALKKEEKPNFAALVYLGRTYYLLDDNESALFFLQKALEMKPDYNNGENIELYYTIGQICMEKGLSGKKPNEQFLDAAIIAYQKAFLILSMARRFDVLTLDSYDVEASRILARLGFACLSIGDDQGALINYQMAYRLCETTPKLNLEIAYVYFRLQMVEDFELHYSMIPEDEQEGIMYEIMKKMIDATTVENVYEEQMPDLPF
ncbi:MAG: tetratricopeptide repeat protein [Prevotellaceae bacterium]|jgi:tetratricopeptide (TPR) repeat protein|nr:tetratricopeptide repeat protein [Prevotellaceae bacterium]